MITSTAFAHKHYAVLGLARSGRATVEALLASGARVTAWDDKEEARAAILPSPSGEGPGVGAVPDAAHPSTSPTPTPSLKGRGLEILDFTTADLTQFDSIVVTPGLPLNRHPIAERARQAGVEIIGDIELFARARPSLPPHRVVGITGTNGKSTTTALVHHILRTAGVPTTMGGNIGLPILAQDPLPEGGVYVLELSSYQIDLTKSLDCDIAVLLNITPDHLDRYNGFEAYARSKQRLFEMQSSGHSAVIPTDDINSGITIDEIAHLELSVREPTSIRTQDWDAAVFEGIAYWEGTPFASQMEWRTLQGPHNAQNAAVAITVCMVLGLKADNIIEGLRTYSGLPHRMERLKEKGGVSFVNDSKATNPTATAPALAAFPAIRWILGGQAKLGNLDECAPHFGHVRKAYTIGEAGPMFARLLREAKVDVVEAGTLEQAVKQAASEAEPGDTVLLSPACASFDQFTDFEARGNAFRAAVEAL